MVRTWYEPVIGHQLGLCLERKIGASRAEAADKRRHCRKAHHLGMSFWAPKPGGQTIWAQFSGRLVRHFTYCKSRMLSGTYQLQSQDQLTALQPRYASSYCSRSSAKRLAASSVSALSMLSLGPWCPKNLNHFTHYSEI